VVQSLHEDINLAQAEHFVHKMRARTGAALTAFDAGLPANERVNIAARKMQRNLST
jgi:hypothetical protein